MATPSRFIAIFAITALGAGFYAGLKATGPDMKATGDYYFSHAQLMDFRLLSTMGFTQEDITELRAKPGVEAVFPTQGMDVLVKMEDGSEPVRLHALPEDTSENNPDYLNRVALLEGRMPAAPNECLADSAAQLAVGDTVNLAPAPENSQDTLDMLVTESFTVVGLVRSPLYISFQRGNATVGSGRTRYFVYLPPDSFDTEYYTEVFVRASSSADLSFDSDEYKQLIDDGIVTLEEFGAVRARIRYEDIVTEANTELDDARQKLADARAEADEKLADALQKIQDGEAELAKGQREIADNARKLADAEQQLADGQKALAEGRRQLEASDVQLEQAQQAFAKEKQAWQQASDQTALLAQGVAAIPAQLDGMNNSLLASDYAGFTTYATGVIQTSAGTALLMRQSGDAAATAAADALDAMVASATADLQAGQFATVNATLSTTLTTDMGGYTLLGVMGQSVAAAQAQLNAALPELQKAEAQLAAAASALRDGWYQLAANETKLADAQREITDGRAELAKGKAKLADAKQELADGRAEYEEKKAEADRELADAQQKIDDAQKKLDDLGKPEWFVFGRDGNPGYSGYESDTNRINAIAIVIPAFFFLVAALVSLTTMTRMVEEQRTQIGTFKALGFTNSSIAFKYLFYAGAASITGGIAGVALGFAAFPPTIWDAYGIMYIMPPLRMADNKLLVFSTIGVSVFTVMLATLAACMGELRAVPAQLMRPKAPRAGQRVFLEHIPFIWKHIKFSWKVTIRNLFRYKKRFFMTVVGVAGCTALLLTGFGLRDSITGIVTTQYGKINFQDMIAHLKDPSGAHEDTSLNQLLPQLGTALYLQETNIDAKSASGNNSGMTTYLSVAEDPELLNQFISFHERKTGAAITFPPSGDGVVITEKLASRLQVKAGDSFMLNRPNEKPVQVTVAGVMENYLLNYVYMPPETYTRLFNAQPEFTIIMLKLHPEQELTQKEISSLLMEDDNIAGVMDMAALRSQMDDMLESLNAVVWLVILSAGLLAFVVLYNLTNINITERAREIATLKVLGFYPTEVAAYVYRENIMLTIIGAAVGLVAGIFLHRFVIKTAEVDEVMFQRVVLPLSYLFSLFFTLLSSMLVNLVMLGKLKKIDMVESLKSAE